MVEMVSGVHDCDYTYDEDLSILSFQGHYWIESRTKYPITHLFAAFLMLCIRVTAISMNILAILFMEWLLQVEIFSSSEHSEIGSAQSNCNESVIKRYDVGG